MNVPLCIKLLYLEIDYRALIPRTYHVNPCVAAKPLLTLATWGKDPFPPQMTMLQQKDG